MLNCEKIYDNRKRQYSFYSLCSQTTDLLLLAVIVKTIRFQFQPDM